MTFSRPLFRLGPGIPAAAIFIAAVLVFAPSSMAGLTLITPDSSFFSSYFTIGVSPINVPATPQYATYNNAPYTYMYAPGGGFPYLSTAPNPAVQNTYTSTIPFPNYFYAPSTTNPVGGPGTYVPVNFGVATTEVYALTSGPAVGTATQGGVYWSGKTTLVNGLSPGSGMASVSISTATATFTNTTPGTVVTLTPGSTLNVNGTVDTSAGGFVAAGLSTSFKLSGGSYGAGSFTPLDSITLAGNNNSGYSNTSGGLDIDRSFANVASGGALTGYGIIQAPYQVTLAYNQSITISATLTLMSGPGSSIFVVPGQLSFDTTPPPDFFGASANSTPGVVPEPSTFLLLGSGLAMAGLWSRSSRRRPAAVA